MNQLLNNLTYNQLHFSIIFFFHEKIKGVKHSPRVIWANTCVLICVQRHNPQHLFNNGPKAFKRLRKRQGKVTLLLIVVCDTTKEWDSRKWSSYMQIWLMIMKTKMRSLSLSEKLKYVFPNEAELFEMPILYAGKSRIVI